jgi:hypothetical protein
LGSGFPSGFNGGFFTPKAGQKSHDSHSVFPHLAPKNRLPIGHSSGLGILKSTRKLRKRCHFNKYHQKEKPSTGNKEVKITLAQTKAVLVILLSSAES